ncbi:MAG: DUF2341 domain-containing protein [Bacteroidota bacterium]
MKQLFTLCLLFLSGFAFSQDCIEDWTYYRTLSITNGDNIQSIATYPYRLELGMTFHQLFMEGKMDDLGADIRLFDEACNPVPFYLDGYPQDPTMEMYIYLENIANAETLNFQLYYGNPLAVTVSNGEEVFLFFDDFSAAEPDPEKWETVGEFATFSTAPDSVLRYNSTFNTDADSRFKFARTTTTFTGATTWEFSSVTGTNNVFGWSSATNDLERYYIRYLSGAQTADTMNLIAVLSDTFDNGFATVTDYPNISIPKNIFNELGVRIRLDNMGELYMDGIINFSNGQSRNESLVLGPHIMDAYHFCISTFSTGNPAELAYIRVFPTIPNPNVLASILGEEMEIEEDPDPMNVFDLLPEVGLRFFPTPSADGFLNLQHQYTQGLTRVEILDNTGRRVRSYDLKADNLQVATGLSIGLYRVVLRDQATGQLLGTGAWQVIKK